ncbi:MAG TPA: hypothetical protein PKV16_06445 [Caldisericia bacterium]|nr:hypothetical protein [Caldisericia bacterium]HPF49720.1 hypothetical protein [Caldisericia bacterium]HPI84571.1 hypothetical protein [Caldisericia bacterium]HPQ93407.1 hypothetical protein [Caldisericia bacterium]HRV74867.1 hypothetical protein [Caldisericia bacterium]
MVYFEEKVRYGYWRMLWNTLLPLFAIYVFIRLDCPISDFFGENQLIYEVLLIMFIFLSVFNVLVTGLYQKIRVLEDRIVIEDIYASKSVIPLKDIIEINLAKKKLSKNIPSDSVFHLAVAIHYEKNRRRDILIEDYESFFKVMKELIGDDNVVTV